MTKNQLEFLALQETRRSNLAREGETNRANVAKETETNRSNIAREAETERSNRASEFDKHAGRIETRRHNVMSENISKAEMARKGMDKVIDTVLKLFV